MKNIIRIVITFEHQELPQPNGIYPNGIVDMNMARRSLHLRGRRRLFLRLISNRSIYTTKTHVKTLLHQIFPFPFCLSIEMIPFNRNRYERIHYQIMTFEISCFMEKHNVFNRRYNQYRRHYCNML